MNLTKETIMNSFHDDKTLALLDLLQSEIKKIGIDSIKKWMAG
jgi:hypothetical protein